MGTEKCKWVYGRACDPAQVIGKTTRLKKNAQEIRFRKETEIRK
jgi:hypothetical protein